MVDLKEKIEQALWILKECRLCPRECRVNRLKDEKGKCKTGRWAVVSQASPHFGEEPELVGRYGSGTIFFSYCNLHCCFCQNYSISQLGEGKILKSEEIAELMLYLQGVGCHNINLVTPTHIVPQILEALLIARRRGLKIPIVYNSGGYESIETLRLLEGVVDIYMPDAKYSNDNALKYSQAPNYWEVNKKALLEMHRQVGDLVIEGGIAKRGLLIRHLILPNRLAGSFEILKFIAEKLSKNSYVNIMDQYYPSYKAFSYPELSRRITTEEYKEVVDFAKRIGLHRGF